MMQTGLYMSQGARTGRFSLGPKICEIINGQFSWILRVDGKEIQFQGSDSAEYFARHYEGLGYQVVWKKEHVA